MLKIFNSIKDKLNNELMNKYTRTLLDSNKLLNCPISSINGYSKSMNFELKNIKTIGDLINVYKKLNYNENEFESYLQVILGIYSKYYLKNIIKQINVIKKFQKLN